MNKVKKLLLMPFDILYRVSPEATLKFLFKLKTGRKLNLANPLTFNEKLQWIKLYYKNPMLVKLVDKYTVREFVGSKAPELLTHLYWNGFDANEIPWDELPDRFVLKVTHGSGYNIICTDKKLLNKKKCVKQLNKWLNEKYLRCYGEWFYGVERPRIIIEEFLDAGNGTVPCDYKFLCFSGEPRYVIVDTDRFSGHKRNVYDLEWNFQPDKKFLNFANDKPMLKPSCLNDLLRYAKILSEGVPHVRVDLYCVNDKIYFGEMTFTNGAGFSPLPIEFDLELGGYLELSKG